MRLAVVTDMTEMYPTPARRIFVAWEKASHHPGVTWLQRIWDGALRRWVQDYFVSSDMGMYSNKNMSLLQESQPETYKTLLSVHLECTVAFFYALLSTANPTLNQKIATLIFQLRSNSRESIALAPAEWAQIFSSTEVRDLHLHMTLLRDSLAAGARSTQISKHAKLLSVAGSSIDILCAATAPCGPTGYAPADLDDAIARCVAQEREMFPPPPPKSAGGRARQRVVPPPRKTVVSRAETPPAPRPKVSEPFQFTDLSPDASPVNAPAADVARRKVVYPANLNISVSDSE